jgi:Sulfotransferase domain
MMVERGDHLVFDEPFSVRYYFSDERRSDRFDEIVASSDAASVVSRLQTAADEQPVFVKDMAYYVSDLLTAELLGGFVNTFLVRRPPDAIASFARKWPDLTEEEAGYAALGEAYRVAGTLSDAPWVIESDELAADPSHQVAAFCSAVGLDFLPEALTWPAGMIEQWERWGDWYETVSRSTGFNPPSTAPAPPLDDPRLAGIAERAQPVYDELAGVAGAERGSSPRRFER